MKFRAFTLAEVLITLGVLGVVAALTLPTLMTNVQELVRKEQLRSAKYKLTLATDKMKSLGLLENQYPTTQDFINELKKHFKIAKICDNNHLTDCWPTTEIELPTESGGTITKSINTIKKGSDLKALGLGAKDTETMGIITADGVPMILTYSPKCSPLDSARTYSWSTVDNKPETNATTNCISAIMDINGKSKPNKLGKDIRTWNSIMGYITYNPASIDYATCQKWKNKLGINECYYDNDYWAGAVKKCYDIGLHLPSPHTLTNIAATRYGRSDITQYTVIASTKWTKSYSSFSSYTSYPCEEMWKQGGFNKSDQIICIDNGSYDMKNNDSLSAIGTQISGTFWSAFEISSQTAYRRAFTDNYSNWFINNRNCYDFFTLCVAD